MSETHSDDPKWSSQILGNPLLWLAVTMLIVLVTYFWMDSKMQEVPSDPVKKLSPEDISSNLENVETLIKQDSMLITNETDDQRAEEYLAVEDHENTIKPLFESADTHYDLGNYVLPQGSNAWVDYQKILQLDPSNNKAKSGQIKIRNLLIDNTQTAIEQGDFADAENWLHQLDIIQPDNPFQSDSRQEIANQIASQAKIRLEAEKEQEKQQTIEKALTQANEEREKNPINYNKIKDLYNRILDIDPDNVQAREGLDDLVSGLMDSAEFNLRAGNYEQSQKYLERALTLDPKNKRISSIQLALDTQLAQQENVTASPEQGATSTSPATESAGADPEKSIEELVAELSNPKPVAVIESDVTIIEETSAEEVASRQKQAQLEEGVQAYYDGDYNKSFELLYPLAEEGLSRAQFRIGVMYRYGRSVSENADLSEKWFTQALPSILRLAQRGEAWAQTDLGTAYELGISLNQDFERAAHWYRLAAEQDYPGAQTNLGVLYANGEGVDYSRSTAVFWLKKAAKQGDLVALQNLSVMGEEL